VKSLRVASLAGALLVSSGLVVNCRDHDVSQITGAVRSPPEELLPSTDRCVPGQTFQCMGGCGASLVGYQVCAADGRSYGPCMCPPLRANVPISSFPPNRYDGEVRIFPGSSLVGGTGQGGSASSSDALVGAACRRDADCGAELDCLTTDGDTLTAGGPAGGYCSRGCGGDADCQAIDLGSRCIGFAGARICVRSCASRATPPGVSKCLGRQDVMCVSVAALGQEEAAPQPQAGLCLPACQSDAQCGAGRFCDLGNGLCTTTRPEGDPVGSICDGADTCASGLCLTLSNRFEGFCSGFCRFGSAGCGFDGSQASQDAACVIAQVPGEGDGDRGFCLELCDTAADCREPGAACIPTAAGSLTRVCVVPTDAPPVTPPALPDAGPAGSPRIGEACEQDSDCGTGLDCLTQDSDPFGLGAGIPGGYCSAPCAGGGCPEPGSICVTTSPDSDGFCLRGCNPAGDRDCGSREALVCASFSNDPDATTGFCFPECITDADCGDGLACDATGSCGPEGGNGGAGGSGQEPEPTEPSTGSACQADDDCDTGTCLSPDQDPFGVGGGLPGGYCSAACGAGNPCTEPGTVCVNVGGGTSLCLRGCEPQAGGDCGERELTCIPFGSNQARGFCIPGCSGDEGECGERVCDPALDLCVDAPAAECEQNEDCSGDEVCVLPLGECVPAEPECVDDTDCDEGECDPETLTCGEPVERECEQNGDCAEGVCDTELGLCVDAPPECTSNAECGEQVCDLPEGVCIDSPTGCSSDAECGEQVCELSSGQCVPPAVSTCTLDADCDEGVCDTFEAACVPTPAIPVGGSCTADGDCALGLCEPLDDVNPVCSGFCVPRTAIGCEAYGSDAFCSQPFFQDAAGNLFGACLELCDITADCEQPSYVCSPLGATLNGRTGLCTPPL
jgi:hypothetical protein